MNEFLPSIKQSGILIVEDSRSLAIAMQRLIRSQLGLKADVAPTLAMAKRLLDQDREGYLLAILDLTLPDADKDQVVLAIAAYNIPSIVFSKEYDEALRSDILNRNIIDFVVKDSPSSLAYLFQLIKRVLKNKAIKVLLVEDSRCARLQATRLLTTYQFIVLEAGSGQEALDILEQQQDIKLVITDYHMPNMNGAELSAKIRTMYTRNTMAIIGLSSDEKDQAISVRFLKAGANDFLPKPYLPEEFFCRISQNLEYMEQIEEIQRHRDLLTREREIIETILTRMRSSARFDNRNLRVLMESVEKTSGDLLLSAFRPDGAQHIMLGDFTGHGLQAALGGPLVAELFYDMTDQNLPLDQIANAINRKITTAMPTDIFLAVGLVEIHPERNPLIIWNCSIPDILIYRQNRLIHRIPSSELPRGIRHQSLNLGHCLELQPGDRIFMFSDGVVEEMNPNEQPFDYIGIEAFIDHMLTNNCPLKQLLVALDHHRQGYEQHDDITLVEISC